MRRPIKAPTGQHNHFWICIPWRMPIAASGGARPLNDDGPTTTRCNRRHIPVAQTRSASWRLCVRFSFDGASDSRMTSTYMDSVGCFGCSISSRIVVVGLNEEGSHAETPRRREERRKKGKGEEDMDNVRCAKSFACRIRLTFPRSARAGRPDHRLRAHLPGPLPGPPPRRRGGGRKKKPFSPCLRASVSPWCT